jgi:hypothetical protein
MKMPWLKLRRGLLRKNLEFGGGTPCLSPSFLCSGNKHRVVDCMQQLGVLLGESDVDKNHSFLELVNVDIERETWEREVADQSWVASNCEEEDTEDLEMNALKSLYGELWEEVYDESGFPLNSELDGYTRKGKFHYKSCLRKTCKVKRVNFSKKKRCQ